MTETTEMAPGPQRLKALARANEVRLARAGLKRRIAQGETTAAQVILACPTAASNWSVGELLISQRRWGTKRSRRFLGRHQISEIKQIGALTERQRQLLATELQACEPAAAELECAPSVREPDPVSEPMHVPEQEPVDERERELVLA